MAAGLQFDETLRKALEMAYLTPDIVSARAEVVRALNLQPGERVLDVGSGPGFLARDLAGCVGDKGSMRGIDPAENMLEAARSLCSDQPWAEFDLGDAMELPYPDSSFDAVVSTQVYEYVPDLDGAVSEFARVLRPGGRGVIVDTDWAVPYWSATDTSVRDQIIEAWREHCAQQAVPMRLSGSIRSANLQIQELKVLPLLNSTYDKNAFSYWVPMIIGAFVLGRNGIEQSDIDSWIAGLGELERAGGYFFCINRYMFAVAK